MSTTTKTRTKAVTLPADAVELLQRLIVDVDAAGAAKAAAADAADAASAGEEATARHRDWERACSDLGLARGRVVDALRIYLPSGRPA